MTRHMLLIPIDGPVQLVEAETHEQMRTAIGADVIERVRVGIDWSLAVDESGRYTDKPVNGRASALYGHHIHGQPIMGDALLGKEGFVGAGVDAGIDWLDTSQEDALEFMRQHGFTL